MLIKLDIYKIKILIRNHRIYEIKIFKNGKFLYRMRDSLIILAGSLASLEKILSPNLKELSNELLDYLKQDIRLLGGIMVNVQQLYWINYHVDIENLITLLVVAMTIFV